MKSDKGHFHLDPLDLDPALCLVSKKRAHALVNHTGSEPLIETSCASRVDEHGVWDKIVAEGYIEGEDDPREVVLSLLIDDGCPKRDSRNSMISPTIKKIGIAMVPSPTQGLLVAITWCGPFKRHPPPAAEGVIAPKEPAPPSKKAVEASVAAETRMYLWLNEQGDMLEYETTITSDKKLGIKLEAKEVPGALEGEVAELSYVSAIHPGGVCDLAGISVGDVVCFVNGESTYYSGLKGTMGMIKKAGRPLCLRLAKREIIDYDESMLEADRSCVHKE
uniref:PDZ domain-containing protein n=1 Tax=Octactis speculum TaxID=3111310 RepID=A0A7S2F6D2_9STRA